MFLIEDAFTSALAGQPRPYRSIEEVASAMRGLMKAGLADIPFPGGGRTLERWQALAAAGAHDLSLAKIYEGHTDALAILAELYAAPGEGLWSVWAAEPPNARVIYHPESAGRANGSLVGRKPYCSGARMADYALVSAWTPEGRPMLARVALRQPCITVEAGGWQAVGMAACESAIVIFNGASACAVGMEDGYLQRPGFWQGGAGIAAVWYGAAVAIARALGSSPRIASDPHAAAHLGAVDAALRGARAVLAESAAWIDTHPAGDAALHALRARAIVEGAANEVLLRAGRALGPGPLCNDAIHAQRCADLPVFLRQSHAEHDLAALGRGVAQDLAAWNL